MSDSRKAIHEDEDEYADLCRHYKEECKNPYGAHARELKQRWREDQRIAEAAKTDALPRPPDEGRVIEAWFEMMGHFSTQGLLDALRARGKLEDVLRNIQHKGLNVDLLASASLPVLLDALERKGGYWAAYARAGRLTLRKGEDYNNLEPDASDEHGAERDEYFPFGMQSYAQMIHVKALRFLSLAAKHSNAINESSMDTALDLINYCAFYVDWADRSSRT